MGYFWQSSYDLWGSNQANTVFVTKGGFLHRLWHSIYFISEFKGLRSMVNSNRTAEDLLMSFLHAALVPPQLKRPVPLFTYSKEDIKCWESDATADTMLGTGPLGKTTST